MISAARTDRARPLRLVVFAAAGTSLALGAHVLAGGAPPGVAVTLLGCLITLLAAVALTRRTRGLVEIGVVLGAVQLILHQLFTAGVSHSGAPQSAASHAGAAHGADPGWMPLAHVGAVVVTALLLARGEHLLDLLLDWLRQVPARRMSVVPPAWFRAPVRLTVADAAMLLPAQRLALAPAVRRGPPVRTC